MVKEPVESTTDLKTCATEIIEGIAAVLAPATELGAAPAKLTTDSDMSSLFKNLPFGRPAHSRTSGKPGLHFNKLALLAAVQLIRPLAALLLAAISLTPALAQAPGKPGTGQTLMVVGDSLSAEYGLRRGTGWVPLLEKQLAKQKKSVKVVNASISGDTTSGGRSRIGALLAQHKPDIVVIELGGNDALRGLSLNMTEQNLATMTQAAKKTGAKVLLLGMQVPPNYGSAYSATFSSLFTKVAKAEKVALVPFFLKGIADVDDAAAQFQADRIHPNEQAQVKMLANVWPELEKLLQ
jgi:acyl-CoA thioesterase-1